MVRSGEGEDEVSAAQGRVKYEVVTREGLVCVEREGSDHTKKREVELKLKA